MPEPSVRVGVDLDGVLAMLAIKMREIAEGVFEFKGITETDYLMGMSVQQVQKVLRFMINRDMIYDLQRHRETRAPLGDWLRRGHQVVYLTGRGADRFTSMFETSVIHDLWKQTYQWLDKYGYPDAYEDNIVFEADKLKFCRESGIDVLIDDNPALVQPNGSCVQSTSKLLVVLRDQPWNRGVEYPCRIMRDLAEVERFCPALAEEAATK